MSRRKTTEEFINDAITVHGDKYDYSLVEYINWKTKVKIICPIHGTFLQTSDSHLRRQCFKCGREKSGIKNSINNLNKQLYSRWF